MEPLEFVSCFTDSDTHGATKGVGMLNCIPGHQDNKFALYLLHIRKYCRITKYVPMKGHLRIIVTEAVHENHLSVSQ
ncbi:MAG: hypothetical protein ABS98_03110 [Lysobacteraceae bacterium SCN 69-48]|nr:MAG: hypothetical protein ABS98_03110 [Xanthomonadaceae bacterium SCN 69-48]